ncbi:MAG: glycogen/starch/alpha-glucan phosphorylase [Candidatus Margulisbacteria bacterium]|nr:glycogen/starch/alpha-glucan phosphorylase [Candidatus Margulisiibacteriota bacterium]
MYNKLIAITKTLSPKAKEILNMMINQIDDSGLSLRGVSIENCSIAELYTTLTNALRKSIIPQWAKTQKAYREHNAKQVFYFSMEFLMGRMTGNNIANLNLNSEVQEIVNFLKKINPNLANSNDAKNDLERIENDWGLGNGGLGRLAACYLDSGATLGLPLHGEGFWYDYGIFKQEIMNGHQTEEPDVWGENAMPWMIEDACSAVKVRFGGHMSIEKGKCELKGYESVEMVPFRAPIIGYKKDEQPNINSLTLWRIHPQSGAINFSDINNGNYHSAYKNVINPNHAAMNSVLYPNDNHTPGKTLRLMQEFALVSAGLQSIVAEYLKNGNNIVSFDEKVGLQINDTHAALLVPELIRILIDEHNLSAEEARSITQKSIAYTNHTVLSEALEKWDTELLRSLLPRQYNIIEGLNLKFCNEIRKQFPNDEDRVRRMSIIQDGQVKMAHLALVGGHSINGVAALHTEILKDDVLHDFFVMFPEKFHNVTNGVTPRRWIRQANPELAELITSLIGDSWITDLGQLEKLAEFSENTAVLTKLLKIKQKNKQALASYIYNNNAIKDKKGNVVSRTKVNPNSIFDVQAKRLHEYKRQLMSALHILMLYNKLKEKPSMSFTPRTFIFAAKAAPGYHTAKNIIKFINMLADLINNDPQINGRIKVVFLENYNVSLAEKLIPAADLSEQISTAGLEASGTGNMKFSLNGALTIGTMDGANVEMARDIGKENMFIFGLTTPEVKQEKTSGYNPWSVYSSNSEIRQLVDQMKNGQIGKNDDEKRIAAELINGLMANDHYLVLRDLPAYAEAQKKVGETYKNPMEWAKLTLLNIARMGYFSSDRSVQEYADDIWEIQPINPN